MTQAYSNYNVMGKVDCMCSRDVTHVTGFFVGVITTGDNSIFLTLFRNSRERCRSKGKTLQK